jgi:hypothetical protein
MQTFRELFNDSNFLEVFFGVDTSLSIPFDDEQSGKEGEKRKSSSSQDCDCGILKTFNKKI